MRFACGMTLLVFFQLQPVAFAQAPVSSINPTSTCNPAPPGESCQKLNCKGPCTEKWVNGQCIGGFCPQGVAPLTAGTDLTIHNVTPELERQIQTLIDTKK
jgi:hypothetical protein